MNDWEARQKHTCNTCKGSGHTKECAPLVKIRLNEKGEKEHVTFKQGSGCLSCGGKGVK